MIFVRPSGYIVFKELPSFYDAGLGVAVGLNGAGGSGGGSVSVTGSLYWFMFLFGRTA